ncbi:uncharacterized protein MONOS_11779 [Monocercomonoides exilis]|uniref:uncharacterized protein n=1 Tax=Monocercomonoides exilis TaxID=2049356 RepID=UPI00355979BA|nr:hypothetical protein MONOS_11779 [Monocercomonoides exilis]|eukprot:MONOS_11779.1-p1 / transcript=MONOS_11779.1 / gene=MONOS_11779 / organism=Monocercomonoides_exilis_PA203 / gene_product=unspecified product / transcript_product=unspecified product / location=Mono_scaffold00610:13913-14338(-) / protein_length=142 / sequence_SO=supercontig / SO=protein_coding / is_pseudo=false
MSEWLSVQDNVNTLQIGQTFYIVLKDVPDYWFDGTQFLEIETEIITLEDYYNKTNVDAMVEAAVNALFNKIYPVNCVIMRYSADDPNTQYTGTTWTKLTTGRYVKLGVIAGETGGSATMTSSSTKLTVDQMPSHSHSLILF